jgi:predicted kinase
MGKFIIIVAFNAVPSSGKSTVAGALVELHG